MSPMRLPIAPYNTDTSHLRGLQRVSPCCLAQVYHPNPLIDDDALAIACVSCGKNVREHWLINNRHEVVWPPPKEAVKRQPAERNRKRSRRTVPLEADPEPYRVLYD